MILAISAVAILWGREWRVLRRLVFPAGAITMMVLTLAWPAAMVVRHGFGALALWSMHVTDRLAARPSEFAGEPWWEYGSGLLIQAMPWTPLAFLGAWHSLRRALAGRGPERGGGLAAGVPACVLAGDRLLWAWSAAPLLLLSLATVKNAHYAIASQVPWSIWAALGISRLAGRLIRRGRSPERLRRAAVLGFAAMGLAYGLGYWVVGPRVDRRGVEWAFYESAARRIPPGEPLVLLYDDWDRKPYDSPFGAFPHDLAVRLFYLGRPASLAEWRVEEAPTGLATLASLAPRLSPLAPNRTPLHVIGRDRDRPGLERLGRVEVLDRGPPVRFDRTYVVFRLTTHPEVIGSTAGLPSRH